MKEYYLDKIFKKSNKYLTQLFDKPTLDEFERKIHYIHKEEDTKKVITKFINEYTSFVKKEFQRLYKLSDKKLNSFLEDQDNKVKAVWGDCYKVLRSMKPESIHLMVTSPPYYNAREYTQWKDLKEYLAEMRLIIREAYRVLDNHRVFVFNVGDIFDNDNLVTKSVWGKRRLPLAAYFIKVFEEEGFTFVDDFIWDKGEVQSERHKNGDKPFPFYQYPTNCYEHILIFHKHRLDKTRYPCPVCGTLQVSGNTQSEPGIQSWECKNNECFTRSKCNRGKRFSLKTLTTQSMQLDQHIIPEEFVKKWRRDIIRFSPVIKINSKGENALGHTAPFPEDIPDFAIRMYSYPGESVLDPFAGSFTSAICAQKLRRVGIGIEINKKLFRDSILRNINKKLSMPIFQKDSSIISEFNGQGFI
ncbi:site-specific DNA-methyltransferase [Patescibacteria group bacterium]|nr:site-specific DNA-methyltransferase [Patescibacteria group bacterium]